LPRSVAHALATLARAAVSTRASHGNLQPESAPEAQPRVLELGSGTGRAALALRAAGINEYVGVESSQRMIRIMRAKPGAGEFRIVPGDFSEAPLPGRFDLIFALVSTFHLLPTAQRQRRAFAHLAGHLHAEGVLLLECYDDAQCGQGSFEHRYLLETCQGPRSYQVSGYASTANELDAMAAAAGLSLQARWADWQRTRWREGDARHISLYRRAR
jgi:SAM-dependent methyltransferase